MEKTQTDIAKRLRDEAETIRHGIDEIDGNKIMRLLKEAADEADRFYSGMMAWKQTAETKDAKLSQEMTDRINERVAARLAAAAPAAEQKPVRYELRMCAEGQCDDWKPVSKERYETLTANGGDAGDGLKFEGRALYAAPVAAAAPVAVLLEKIATFPELNMNNYDEDQVRTLNEWGITVATMAEELPSAAAPVADERKPVAWMTPNDWGDTPVTTAFESVAESWKREHRQVTPLYE